MILWWHTACRAVLSALLPGAPVALATRGQRLPAGAIAVLGLGLHATRTACRSAALVLLAGLAAFLVDACLH